MIQLYALKSGLGVTLHHDNTKPEMRGNPIQCWCSLGVPQSIWSRHRTTPGFLTAPDNHCSPYQYDFKSSNLKEKSDLPAVSA